MDKIDLVEVSIGTVIEYIIEERNNLIILAIKDKIESWKILNTNSKVINTFKKGRFWHNFKGSNIVTGRICKMGKALYG